jgi:hypothetical protein
MGATLFGSIRKRLTAPPAAEVMFTTRGFATDDAPAREQLEFSAFQLMLGFEFGVEQKRQDDVVLRLESVQREYRGFAYEGAAMGLALRDAMSPTGGHRHVESFLAGPEFDSAPGSKHVFMSYLGVGFTLAHLPKMLWKRALPDYRKLADYPAMRWLVMDGYGFHLAYFDHEKYVNGQHVGRGYPGFDPDPYTNRAIDQGIGRAMWFVHGANVKRYVAAIKRFPETRQPDLFAGAGVAASYAGGVELADLEWLMDAAGPYRAEVAQGAVFALRARVVSDTLTPHNDLAAKVFCGCTPEEANEIGAVENPILGRDDSGETYELYRQRIMQHFR